MPLARISVPSHLPTGKIRALADAVQDGLVTTCEIPPKDRFQLITRFVPDDMIIDPTFPDVERTADASIVEITMVRRSTQAQKDRLYKRIVSLAEEAGFVGDDILISISENDRGDWSAGRGESYASGS